MSAENRRKPFRIAELVIAAVIIGVVILGMHHQSVKNLSARETEARANLHNIQLGVERYCVDSEGEYPRFLIGGCPGNNGETPLDPLLAGGYLDTYPRSPFVRLGRDPAGRLDLLQSDLAVHPAGHDPLRPGDPFGDVSGYRFGTDGTLMGQVLCNPRLAYWLEQDAKPEPVAAPDWAAVEYHFWDMWAPDASRVRQGMPGQFFYKTLLYMEQDHAGYPFTEVPPPADAEINWYLLGCYGSPRTKGQDVIGEEHLAPLGRNWSLDPAELAPEELCWSWTRSVNDPDSREGSPFAPRMTSTEIPDSIYPSFDYTNSNGIPDSVLLVLHTGIG